MDVAQAPDAHARVLIVEDNRDAAAAFLAVLQWRGHDVWVAADGASALETARRVRPEVIVCDIGLPDGDGVTVIQSLKREPGLSAVRVCALTAHTDGETRQRAEAAGFDAYLVKPPNFADLLEFVERPTH
jgi:CheY-like chemotaxis protein